KTPKSAVHRPPPPPPHAPPQQQPQAQPVAQPPVQPQGEELPYRVFGGPFKLDPQASLAYRGWRPQNYQSIEAKTENTLTWSLGARAKLWFLTIYQLSYESN